LIANAIETPNAPITIAAADRAGDVVGHRVERDGRRQVVAVDQRREERLLRRQRERGEDPEDERESEDDLLGRGAAERERRERTRQCGLSGLGREQQPPPVEAVGCRSGPGREQQDRPELRELEHSEQQRRVREPPDEDSRGEVLEPRPARGAGVSREVRPEVPVPQKPPDRPGPSTPRSASRGQTPLRKCGGFVTEVSRPAERRGRQANAGTSLWTNCCGV
jgi:hypothetical protein